MTSRSALSALLSAAVLVLPAAAKAADNTFWVPGLPPLHWSMGLEQIQMFVGAGNMLHHGADALLEATVASGEDCSLLYRFRFFADKLITVEATIPADGCHLDKVLATRYGPPKLYTGRDGYVSSSWEGGKTEINMHLPPSGRHEIGWVDFSDGSIPKIPAD